MRGWELYPMKHQSWLHLNHQQHWGKWWVTAVGDSFLQGRCQPDLYREVCCLPGAQIQDVNERLKKPAQPLDYYSLLLIHIGTMLWYWQKYNWLFSPSTSSNIKTSHASLCFCWKQTITYLCLKAETKEQYWQLYLSSWVNMARAKWLLSWDRRPCIDIKTRSHCLQW